MSICLFPHVGYLSETSRMIAVYKELVKLGKDVVMATHGGTYESILKEEKIEYVRVDPEMTVDQCRAFVLSNTVDGRWGSFYTPDELDEDVKDFLRTDKPKIYIALTSSRGAYVKALLKVLSAMDAQIITVTTVHDIDSFGNGNVLAKAHLPSHKVMPLVDLAIIHGGQGSVQTAVASGTPIIGFPLQTEQHFNLALIENKGAGINYPLQYLEYPERIKTAVNRILSDSSYKQRMMDLKALQENYDGPAEVARQISELV